MKMFRQIKWQKLYINCLKNVQVEIQAFCSKQLIHENILTKLGRYACRCAPNVSLGI